MSNVVSVVVTKPVAGSPSMTVAQARAVSWFRNNPRPMGELLDEGVLSQRDLRWAADNSFVSPIKEAAAVLLAAGQTTITPSARQAPIPQSETVALPASPMTLEAARNTVWPFASFQGQTMGALFDSGVLSHKELGRAIDIAWNPIVRQAATTLLLHKVVARLNEPEPPAGPLRVMAASRRSYAEHGERVYTLGLGLFCGVVMTILLGNLVYQLTHLSLKPPSPELQAVLATTPGLIGLAIALLIAVATTIAVPLAARYAFDGCFRWFDRRIDAYRAGREGESRVVDTLCGLVDGRWTLFRNVDLPGRNSGDLDVVLVGPAGVWVLEVKTFSGSYRNHGDAWHYRTKHGWRLVKNDPGHQARKNAKRLKEYLKAVDPSLWVECAVVWAHPTSQLIVENPITPVWRVNDLPNILNEMWQHQPLRLEAQDAIRLPLQKLCANTKK